MIQTIGRVNANGTFNNISVISPVAVGLIGGGNRYSQREKKQTLK
jgi:transcription elongation GreA/GreB family factor